jgi:hypothetical protein
MQQFPRNTEAEGATPGAQDREPTYEIEQHREDDEPDATRDWLAHLAAGRIEVR